MLIVNRMVNKQMLDATYGALADATRRQIIERLIEGEATLSELAAPHAMSLPAVMKHVAKLEDVGLLNRRKCGRVVTCSLNVTPLDDAAQWLQEHLAFWNTRLDALERYIERQKEGEE